jgi:EF hand
MQRQVTVLIFSALLLAAASDVAAAQQHPTTVAAQGESQQRLAQAGRVDRYDADDEEEDGRDRRRRQGPPMWNRNRQVMPDSDQYDRSDERHRGDRDAQRRGFPLAVMGAFTSGRSGMMQMMMILMDIDGDGAISLQEFQAGQERIFKALGADKDGRLTLDEIRSFHRGQSQTRDSNNLRR